MNDVDPTSKSDNGSTGESSESESFEFYGRTYDPSHPYYREAKKDRDEVLALEACKDGASIQRAERIDRFRDWLKDMWQRATLTLRLDSDHRVEIVRDGRSPHDEVDLPYRFFGAGTTTLHDELMAHRQDPTIDPTASTQNE